MQSREQEPSLGPFVVDRFPLADLLGTILLAASIFVSYRYTYVTMKF